MQAECAVLGPANGVTGGPEIVVKARHVWWRVPKIGQPSGPVTRSELLGLCLLQKKECEMANLADLIETGKIGLIPEALDSQVLLRLAVSALRQALGERLPGL